MPSGAPLKSECVKVRQPEAPAQWNGASRRRFLEWTATATASVAVLSLSSRTLGATTIRIAVALPEAAYIVGIIKHWGALVEKRSGGALIMRIFPGGSLIRGEEAFDALNQNTVQFSDLPNPYATPKARDLAPLDLPGAFPADRIVATHDAIYDLYNEILNKQKLHYMFALDSGRNTIAVRSGGPVKHPDQLKGKIIRDNGTWPGRLLQAWGATPQTIMIGDLVPALQRGTADGVMIGTPGLSSMKLYENTPFVTIFPSAAQFYYYVAGSLDFLQSLPPQHTKLLHETAREAMEWGIKVQEQQTTAIIERMRQAGATVYTLTTQEEAVFHRGVDQIHERMRSQIGPQGHQLLAILKRLAR